MSRRSLRLSLFDVFFFSIMVGAGESYLPAFALSAGMGETLAGLFSSVPLLVAALVQLVTPFVVRRVGSIKKYVVSCAVIQALSFLPLIYFSLYGTSNFLVLFLIATVYWGAGFAAGPTWNFWMGQLVADTQSADYFSRRTRISQMGILLGLVGGGLALQNKISVGPFTSVFSVLFAIAFISRASSGLILSAKKYESHWTHSSQGISLRVVVRRLFQQRSYIDFFGFLFLFYVAIMITSPFVSPFFLAKLHLDYFQYMVALASLFLAKIVTLSFTSQLIRRWNARTVLFIGAIGISPLPALWGVSDHFWFVILVQTVSGAFWGLFEVALTVIFFQQIKHSEKIPILTFYNFFNASATILGSLIGAQVLHSLNESLKAYTSIFIYGSLLRLVIAIYYAHRFRGKEILSLR